MDNDYELLYLAKDDDQVKDLIYQKYKNLIYYKARKYSQRNNTNNELEDYISEGTLALYETIDNYHDTTPYNIYLNRCLDNALKNAFRKNNTKKSRVLSEATSLNSTDYLNISSYDKKYDPELQTFEEYNYNKLKKTIISKLTWQEELVFKLKEQNYKPKEISEIIDNNQRTVYNIINRIRKKVSSIVSNKNNY